MFKVLDSISSSVAGRMNEDYIGVCRNIAWVLDGTTGIGNRYLPQFPSDARWFVRVVSKYLKDAALCGFGMMEALQRAMPNVLTAFSRHHHSFSSAILPAASFLGIESGKQSIRLFNLGDCRAVIRSFNGDIAFFGDSFVSQLDAKVINEINKIRIEQSVSYEEIWKKIMPVILSNRQLRNKENGYWVLDGTIEPLKEIQDINLKADCLILIMTDGFYRLVETFHYFTWQELLHHAQYNGLSSLLPILRQIEEEDPECIKFPRIKKSDDASALLLQVTINRKPF